MNFLKERLDIICCALLVLVVLAIFSNAVVHGINQIITQKMIDNTYRIG